MAERTKRRTRRTELREGVKGGYVPLPWVVLDSPAYQTLTATAKALLIEIARQHNPHSGNNGSLAIGRAYLASRGFNSPHAVQRALDELQKHRLIVRTFHGTKSRGPSRWALTWHSLSYDSDNMDIARDEFVRNDFLLWGQPPEQKLKSRVPNRHSNSTEVVPIQHSKTPGVVLNQHL